MGETISNEEAKRLFEKYKGVKFPSQKKDPAAVYEAPNEPKPESLEEGVLVKHDYVPPDSKEEYTALNFKDPVLFLYCFLPILSEGHQELYRWQKEELRFINSFEHTKEYSLIHNLVACNGSGKDAYILAGSAVFRACCLIRSRTVITSKSFKQLQFQTYPSVVNICRSVNKKLESLGLCDAKDPFLLIYQGHVVCTRTGSEIVMFVTDDPGRAEGFHPFPDYAKSDLMLAVNEAKSVDKDIYTALRRCTGYSRWLNISSTGPSKGEFYDNVQKSIHYPEPYQKNRMYCRKVTAYECPSHYTKDFLEREKHDLDPDIFASIYESEFISLGDSVVVPISILKKAASLPNLKLVEDDYVGGLDLSLGGDEAPLYLRHGVEELPINVYRTKDVFVLQTGIVGAILQSRFPLDKLKMFVDVGGLGQPIFQYLKKALPTVTWIGVNNGAPPVKSKHKTIYANVVTEDYFHVKSLLIRGFIRPPVDKKTYEQLSERQFEIAESGRFSGRYMLQSKQSLRSEGYGSPDRSDAWVLMWRRYKFHNDGVVSDVQEQTIATKPQSIDELIETYEQWSEEKLNKSLQPRERVYTLNQALKYYAN